MNNLTKVAAGVILIAALVILGLVASRSTEPTYSQESVLPPGFTVGATIQLDFGAPLWRIEEIRGPWLKVTDASSEPMYTGMFWINGTTGRIWGVRHQSEPSLVPTVPPRE